MKTVDVSKKPESYRSATACGRIRLSPDTLKAIKEGKIPKGDVLSACRLAGIMGAKKTAELLPFCHPLAFDHVEVHVKVGEDHLEVWATVGGIARTGYEMEALTAVSTALLTIYDMCKGMDESMVIESVKLVEKRGGKSQWSAPLEGVRVRVISSQEYTELIRRKLLDLGAQIVEEDFQLTVSTEPVNFSLLWGVSSVINQKLFSLFPERLKRGVLVGVSDKKPCLELQKDTQIIEAFFDHFGTLIGNWIDGEAV